VSNNHAVYPNVFVPGMTVNETASTLCQLLLVIGAGLLVVDWLQSPRT
jgi:hypothetical protein